MGKWDVPIAHVMLIRFCRSGQPHSVYTDMLEAKHRNNTSRDRGGVHPSPKPKATDVVGYGICFAVYLYLFFSPPVTRNKLAHLLYILFFFCSFLLLLAVFNGMQNELIYKHNGIESICTIKIVPSERMDKQAMKNRANRQAEIISQGFFIVSNCTI